MNQVSGRAKILIDGGKNLEFEIVKTPRDRRKKIVMSLEF